jgi:predicted O-methyltransferase YrrM
MKINLEKAASYIDTLYQSDEATKNQYLDATELTRFGTVVGSDVARMLQLLLHMIRPQRILEIGTSIGYSTVSMAVIAREYGGTITTIEYNEQSARQAIKNFEQAGVADLIEVKIGDAREIIPTLKESFDLIFQDVGDKRLYPELLNNLVALLKPGGVLLAEDSLLPVMNVDVSMLKDLSFDQKKWKQIKDSMESLEEFNKMIASCPSLKSTLLPIGDGLTIGIKIFSMK